MNIFKRISLWFKSQFYADKKTQTYFAIPASTVRSYFATYTSHYNIKISDRQYARVKKDWLLHGYYNYFIKVLSGLSIGDWEEKYDCDNFAELYKAVVQACHNISSVEIEGIAVGIVWYRTDAGTGHAVNTAIVNDDEIIFIEPQTGRQIELSPTEVHSICFVLF